MTNFHPRRNLATLILILFATALSGVANTSHAGIIVTGSTAAGWFTARKITGTGAAGDVVTVTFANGTTKTATVNAAGNWTIFPGATNPTGPGTVSSTLCPVPAPIVVAQLLDPPNNFAVAEHTVLAGSTASAGGGIFILTGGYTLTATAFDSNPLSPTFGDLSGAILASYFNLTGTGALGTIGLELNAGQPYTVNMLPVLTASDPIGSSIGFNIPVSGTVIFNSLVGAFSGTVSGTSTYGEDATETMDYTLNLTSDFGDITGSVSSFGQAQIVPEPSSFAIFGIGALILGTFRSRCRFSRVTAMQKPTNVA